ncbi:hypothetical protein H4219_002645 [Mycoemilia scoparia]|uniref:DNA 3'-5' helicase n=1 Tax=Mycoemilia scoparia TaxID=417184 RepID=A0A9W8DUH4_9FUNG|nr:hypothetical protein H4219_002645 [Mycoemilia scoparia]
MPLYKSKGIKRGSTGQSKLGSMKKGFKVPKIISLVDSDSSENATNSDTQHTNLIYMKSDSIKTKPNPFVQDYKNSSADKYPGFTTASSIPKFESSAKYGAHKKSASFRPASSVNNKVDQYYKNKAYIITTPEVKDEERVIKSESDSDGIASVAISTAVTRLDPIQSSISTEPMDKPLLIVAGAGTGKTTTLCHRVAHMIAQGIDPRQIMVVTFTNKAAKELQTRLGLIASPNSGDNTNSSGLSPNKPYATTFHSYCYQLLLRYHKEIKFHAPPGIITTQPEQLSLIKMVINELKDRSILKNCEKLVAADESYKSEGPIPAGYNERWEYVEKYILNKGLSNLVNESSVPLQAEPKGKSDSGHKKLMKAFKSDNDREIVQDIVKKQERHSKIYTILGEKYLRDNEGKHKDIHVADISNIYHVEPKDALAFIQKSKVNNIRPKECLDIKMSEVYAAYILWLRRFGLVDFDDMLIYANDILKIDWIRKREKERFTYLLVDEFQDLNRLQMDLVLQLQGDRGYVTAVGDERQSIYGFRGAASTHNFQTFLDYFVDAGAVVSSTTSSFSGKGKLRSLTNNYRSTHSIVEFGNKIASMRLSSSTKASDGNADNGGLFNRLRADLNSVENPDNKEGNTPIQLWKCDTELVEAKIIAKEIKWLLDTKQCKHSDIAILCRCLQLGPYSTTANIQRELLSLGIPVLVRGGQSLMKSSEWILFLSILRVIANYRDDLAMAVCLKKATKGVGDVTINRIINIGGVPQKYRLNLQPKAEAENKISQALAKEGNVIVISDDDDDNILGIADTDEDEDLPASTEEKVRYAITQRSIVKPKQANTLGEFLKRIEFFRSNIGRQTLSEWVKDVFRTFIGIEEESDASQSTTSNNNKPCGDLNMEQLTDCISSFETTHISFFSEWGVLLGKEEATKNYTIPSNVYNKSKPLTAFQQARQANEEAKGIKILMTDQDIFVKCTQQVLHAFIAHASLISGTTEHNGALQLPRKGASETPNSQDNEAAKSGDNKNNENEGNKEKNEVRAVIISTIHQAKGLEWPVVFVPHFNEGFLPMLPRPPKVPGIETKSNNNNVNFAAGIFNNHHYEEERRLAYVACTRAEKALYLTSVVRFNASKMLYFLRDLMEMQEDSDGEETYECAQVSRYLPKKVVNGGYLSEKKCKVDYIKWTNDDIECATTY